MLPSMVHVKRIISIEDLEIPHMQLQRAFCGVKEHVSGVVFTPRCCQPQVLHNPLDKTHKRYCEDD